MSKVKTKEPRKNIIKAIRNSKYLSVWELLILSVFMMIVALMMLAVPGMKGSYFIYVGGFVLVAVGVWQIVMYFKKDMYKDLSSYGFAMGLMLLCLGIFSLLRADTLSEYDHMLMGLLILVEGVMELQHTIQVKVMNSGIWYVNLCIALFTLIITFLFMMGFVGSINGSSDVMYALVLVSGILGIVSMVLVLIRVKAFKKEALAQEAVMHAVPAEYVGIGQSMGEVPGGNADSSGNAGTVEVIEVVEPADQQKEE